MSRTMKIMIGGFAVALTMILSLTSESASALLLPDSAREVALRFVAAINARDAAALGALMAEDCVLTDPLGQIESGRDRLQKSWTVYFKRVPDYKLAIEATFSDPSGSTAFFGKVSGTFTLDGQLKAENHYETPIAVLINVREGRVARYQLYADQRRLSEIVSRQPKS